MNDFEIEGNIIDDLIDGLEKFNNQKKTNDKFSQNLPCDVDYFVANGKIKELRGKLVPFIINEKKYPVLQFTYHYGFKGMINTNEKIVCMNYSNLNPFEEHKPNFQCPVCSFINESEHYNRLKSFNYMAWKNVYPFNKKYIKNPAALAKLEFYRKLIYQLNPSMIYYFLFIPKPFKGEIKIVRIYPDKIAEILAKIKKETLADIYSVFRGKDTIFKIKGKTISDIEFVDGDHIVSNKKTDVDDIKKTITELDILKRMGIIIEDEKYYQDLVVDFYETMMSILETKYKIVWDEDENKFIPKDYIGNDNDTQPKQEEPEIENEEPDIDIDLGDDIPF